MILFPWITTIGEEKDERQNGSWAEEIYKEKDVNMAEYPPLFKLDVIRDISLSFAV
jgi:hypothetical protein